MTKVVNDDSFTIGRSLDCTISLSDESISRVHLVVYRRADQVWVEDKNSSNGTFINGDRIAQATMVNVQPTDPIILGKSDYLIQIDLKVSEKSDGKSGEPDGADVMQSPFALKFKTPAKAFESVRNLAKDIQSQLQRDPGKEPMKENPPPEPELKEEAKEPLSKTVPLPSLEIPQEIPKEVIKGTPPNEEQSPSDVAFQQHRQSLDEAKEKSAITSFEAERLVHEARKKAAQILYEGEVQAEKRVQTIYQKARDLQIEAETFHKEHIADAHRRADSIIEEFQRQGQELLSDARQFASELREEVEMYVQNLREKGRREVEDMLDAANQETDAIRNGVMEKAKEAATVEAEKMLAAARAEAQELSHFAQMKSEAMLAKAQSDCESTMQELDLQLDHKRMELRDASQELSNFKSTAFAEKEGLKEEIEIIQKDLNHKRTQLEEIQGLYLKTRDLEANNKTQIEELAKEHEDLRNKIFLLGNEKKVLDTKIKDAQDQLGHATLELQSAEERKRMIENEYSQQKGQFRDRLERELEAASKNSQERLEHSQLEVERRLQKLERDLFDEILNKKDKMAREILAVVETRIAKIVEASRWSQVSAGVLEGIHEIFEGKAVQFSQGSSGTSTQAALNLPLKKKKEKYRWLASGVAAGLALTFAGQYVYNIVVRDRSPMQTMVQEESRRRQEDLARRRFNPPQTPELRDSYSDSVIYTTDFVRAYLDPQFQQKLYKATSAYLLKTWRIDEDKSIQVLSMASALVKELADKKQNIHPDFVKDGLGKMKSLETDSTNRMKDVLGSEVRLESFRRFERKFYEQEAGVRRGIATEKPK